MSEQQDHIMRLPDVERRTGLSKPRIYALERNGEFPAGIRLSRRAVGWSAAEIEAWIAKRPRRLDAKPDHGADAERLTNARRKKKQQRADAR